MIKKACVIKKILGHAFYAREFQNTNQNKFRTEKVIKKRRLNVKWKGYDSSFDVCIDKKDIV